MIIKTYYLSVGFKNNFLSPNKSTNLQTGRYLSNNIEPTVSVSNIFDNSSRIITHIHMFLIII